MSIPTIERYRGSILGLAAGDAVGTTVEFQPPGSFEPVTDMIGGGVFQLQPGQWTDDTSMALCLAESLIGSSRFDCFAECGGGKIGRHTPGFSVKSDLKPTH